MGPLEVVVLEFQGDRFKSETLGVVATAVASGALRVIDVTFLSKDASGVLASHELAEMDEHAAAQFDLVDMTLGLLSVDDLERVGAELTPGSYATLMVVEHQWAADLERAVSTASGRLVAHVRIPCEVASAALTDAGIEHSDLQRLGVCLDDS